MRASETTTTTATSDYEGSGDDDDSYLHVGAADRYSFDV